MLHKQKKASGMKTDISFKESNLGLGKSNRMAEIDIIIDSEELHCEQSLKHSPEVNSSLKLDCSDSMNCVIKGTLVNLGNSERVLNGIDSSKCNEEIDGFDLHIFSDKHELDVLSDDIKMISAKQSHLESSSSEPRLKQQTTSDLSSGRVLSPGLTTANSPATKSLLGNNCVIDKVSEEECNAAGLSDKVVGTCNDATADCSSEGQQNHDITAECTSEGQQDHDTTAECSLEDQQNRDTTAECSSEEQQNHDTTTECSSEEQQNHDTTTECTSEEQQNHDTTTECSSEEQQNHDKGLDSICISDVTHALTDGCTETSSINGNEEDNVLNQKDDSEVQDMTDEQSEANHMTARIEDCFTISDTEMDFSENGNELGPSTKSDMELGGEAVSPSEAADENEKLNETMTDQDQRPTDENVDFDGDCDDNLDVERTEDNTCDIKITESVSVAEDFSADSETDLRLYIAVSDDEQDNKGEDTVVAISSPGKQDRNVVDMISVSSPGKQNNNEDLVLLSSSGALDTNREERVTVSSLAGNDNESESSREGGFDSKINPLPETECEAEKNSFKSDKNQLDIEVDKLSANNEMNSLSSETGDIEPVSDVSQEKSEATIDSSDIIKEDRSLVQCKTSFVKKMVMSECDRNDLMEIDNKQSDISHSTNQDCHNDSVEGSRDSPTIIESIDVHSHNKDEPMETAHEMNKANDQEFVRKASSEDIRTEKVTEEKSAEERHELKNNAENIFEDSDMDDEVLFVDVDCTGKSEPSDFSVHKNNFLQKPYSECRNKIISNSEEDSIVIDDPESSKLVEVATINKPPPPVQTAVKNITDQQDEKTGKVSVNDVLANGEVTENSLSEKSQNRESPVGNRKRHKEKDGLSSSKRSRLDVAEDQVAEKFVDKDVEVLDSDDDDVILAEETPAQKNVPEVVKDDSPVFLTTEALQSLITIRVRAFLGRHKQACLDKLNQRTRSLQSASGLWKETAKHLEKSVVELTSLNQKLEKCKSSSAKMKQQTSRTVGVQVAERKVNSMSAAAVNGSPLKKPETVTPGGSSLCLPPQPQPIRHQQSMSSSSNYPVIRSPSHSPGLRGSGRPTRAPAPIHSSTPSLASQRAVMTPHRRIQQPANTTRHPATPPSSNNVSNLIDLTDEEDTTRKAATQTSKALSASPGTRTISKLSIGTTVAAPGHRSTQTGFITQGTILTSSSSSSLQAPSSATQAHVVSNKPVIGVAGTQYQLQLVPINNSAASRSDPGLALAQGLRQAAPARVSLATARTTASVTKIAAPENASQMIPSAAVATTRTASLTLPPSFLISQKHPAPLPSTMDTGNAPIYAKSRPPKPGLKISRVSQGIVLSWNMPPLHDVEKIASYQLFAYQESDSAIPRSSLWKKVGDVKALPLPMACTLTQFQEGNKYHFAVRAVDQYGRWGSYSDPSSIFLGTKS